MLSTASIASPGSDILSDEANSSLPDGVSNGGASADITTDTARYSEFACSPYRKFPKHRILLVYYRVFAEDGAIPSANPTYSDDPYLGRISAKLVAPPHTAMALKRCLLRVESIGDTTPTYLFNAISSQIPMDDACRVSLLVYPGLGSTPNEPIALVCMFDKDRTLPVTDEVKPEAILLPSKDGPTPFQSKYRKHYTVVFDISLTWFI